MFNQIEGVEAKFIRFKYDKKKMIKSSVLNI